MELSKLHMFKFHYQVMKPVFEGRIEVCFMDTDSFLYHIHANDVQEKLAQLSMFFDFSNYPSNHPLYSIENKNKPGKFKDEMKGVPIVQFCGLRSKCYSLVTSSDHKIAAAGVKKSKHSSLHHHIYVEVLSEFSKRMVTQKTITSKAHKIFTQEQTRVGLSALDIKRHIFPDGITTVPHGYFE